MAEDSEETENDSDIDSHVVKIINNLELEDEEQKSVYQEAITSPGMFVVKIKE